MKQLLLLSLLFFTRVSVEAQNVTRQFDINKFSRIDVASAIDVVVRPGDYNIEADMPKGTSQYLDMKVERNTLVIRYKLPASEWMSTTSRKGAKVTITMPTIEGITLSGAADGNVSNFRDLKDLSIQVSGASDLIVRDIAATRISVKAQGASDVTMTGRADILQAELQGSSDLSAGGLQAEEVVVRAQGASDAVVNARKKITKQTKGGSDVTVRGQPSEVVSTKFDN